MKTKFILWISALFLLLWMGAGCGKEKKISCSCECAEEKIPIETNSEGKRYIRKARQKTEVKSLIPLHPIAEQLLSLYTKEKSKGDYKIFPDTMSKGKLSTRLKAVGLACGIRTPLTWHVARHSFGTLSLEAGIPMESIAKMMGHSSIASTQIYAQITNQKIAKDMDRLIVKNAKKKE